VLEQTGNRAEKDAGPGPAQQHRCARILVWDAPVRVFHWSLAATFVTAYVSGGNEKHEAIHVAAGVVIATLFVFRLLWGFVGSRYARFAGWSFGPAALRDYLLGVLRFSPPHYTGHNPATAQAVLALIAIVAVLTASGFASYYVLGGDWIEMLHALAAKAMLALAAVHVVGVLLASITTRENLPGGMWHGRKRGREGDGIASQHWPTAVALVAAIGIAIWLAPR